jgi:K+-sensing histidine kinase KdpD
MDAAPKRFGSLFDSVSVGLCAVDGDGRILHANSALHDLLRWNPDEWAGQPLARYLQQAIVDPAQALVWTVALSEALSLGKTTDLNLPIRFRTKPGEDDLENITGVAIATNQIAVTGPGAIVAVYGPEVARSTEGVRARLFSAVSHEFRSPISNVATAAHLLSTTMDFQDERQRRLVDIIQAEVARLQRLIAQFVSEPPAAQKQPTLTRNVVTLRPLLRRIAQVFRLRGSGHAIMLQVQPDLPFAWGDADAIQQVLSNLVDNALKHAPPQSTITLTAEAEPERICIRIVDAGPGVPPEERERLFRPAASGTVPDEGGRGRGLGLTISMSLVKGMGGELWYEEQAPDKHCFCFTLPRADRAHGEIERGGE